MLREFEKYHELKAAIRAESNKKNNKTQPNPQHPQPATDVEQIKMQLRKEIKQE